MTVVVKDLHLKKKEPFLSATKNLFDWILNQDFNNSNTNLIQLGDWFDAAVPDPVCYDITESFLNKSRFKHIFLLGGNHDYSTSEKTYSILPLRNNPRVSIITEPCVKEIDGESCAFLPHLGNVKKMIDCYSNLDETFIDATKIFYHFDDTSVTSKGIDLSYLKGKRIGGHEHLSRENYELGMPINSCYTEREQKNNLYFIDLQPNTTLIDIPRFVDYYSVEYGQDLPDVEATFPIWNIENAPSKKQGELFYKEKYPSIYIHEVHVVNKKKKEIKKENSKSTSQVEFLEEYTKERTDLKDWALTRLKNIVMKKG